MGALILLIVHMICMVIFFILSYKDVLKVSRLMLMIVMFVPFAGMIGALLVHYELTHKLSGNKAKDTEAMVEASISKAVSLKKADAENAIPLEDALIMDDRRLRRSVMMDVLMDDSKDYASLINKARMNDDVEVVHYATTATIQITKDYEDKLQHCAEDYKRHPHNKEKLDEYIDVLERYLNSGILQGSMLKIQEETYFQLLAERINFANELEDYVKLANNYMNVGNYDFAENVIGMMEEAWPDSESTWLLQIRYYYDLGMGKNLHKLIARIKNGNFYKSKKLQDVIAFWE